MVGGGGPRADHGLGRTEDNYGMFNGGAKSDLTMRHSIMHEVKVPKRLIRILCV